MGSMGMRSLGGVVIAVGLGCVCRNVGGAASLAALAGGFVLGGIAAILREQRRGKEMAGGAGGGKTLGRWLCRPPPVLRGVMLAALSQHHAEQHSLPLRWSGDSSAALSRRVARPTP